MSVKAKFQCISITDNGYNIKADFSAVYGTSGENADFTKATPSGTISMWMDKDAPASKSFKPLDYIYVVFEEVE